jgi:TPR repeat protein
MDIVKLIEEAEAGSVVAQSILGICYFEGIDVGVDYDEAFRLLSMASNRGVMRARFYLARMYAEGLGITKSQIEAVRLYEAAASAGEFLAQVEMGRIYSRGLGVPSNPDIALKWYSAAIAKEDKLEDCLELREAKAYVQARKLDR